MKFVYEKADSRLEGDVRFASQLARDALRGTESAVLNYRLPLFDTSGCVIQPFVVLAGL